MSLTVSVIIPVHNHARYVGTAVESALAQTRPAHEVIVVDDGSTDETPHVLARYSGSVRVLRQPNHGVAVARNTGVGVASGDLIAFLDADDIWLPRKLERQVALFEAGPELGLVHCGMEEIDVHGTALCRRLNGRSGWVATEMLLWRRPVILGGGSGAVIPRAVLRQVGGLDTALSTSTDWDLYYRIARRYRVGFVPEVLVRYRLHSGNMHGNVPAMERDMMLVYAKAFADTQNFASRDARRLKRLRRRCYANLHAVLAGSYLSAGHRAAGVRHMLLSLWLGPDNFARISGYFGRRHQRRGVRRQGGAPGCRAAGHDRAHRTSRETLSDVES